MSRANPKAVRLAESGPTPEGKAYWDARKAYNLERFTKKPDAEKLSRLHDEMECCRQKHVEKLHAPCEKKAPVFHDQGKFNAAREAHVQIKEKFKASFRYMKNRGWNEKALRKFYAKYGFQ